MKRKKFYKHIHGLCKKANILWLSFVCVFNLSKRSENRKKSENDWKSLFLGVIFTVFYMVLVLWMVKVRW
ncbi:hypothetical protein DSECCO2_231060 [anaerobic digester metagenome]